MLENNENNQKTKDNSIKITISLFVLTIILNIGLFAYNKTLDTKYISISESIESNKKSISKLKEDKGFERYNLQKDNQQNLYKYEKYSRIPEYIKKLKEISKQYEIRFEGFNYYNGVIETKVIANQDERNTAVEKAKKFIDNYRQDPKIKEIKDAKLKEAQNKNKIKDEKSKNNTEENKNNKINKELENKNIELENKNIDFELSFVDKFDGDGKDNLTFNIKLTLK